MMEKNHNVCLDVVANNLCAGCGLCVGICPQKTLQMKFNEFGEYEAFDKNGVCRSECRLCLQVCPFSDQADIEDVLAKTIFKDVSDIKHRPETGYHLNCLVGHSNLVSHRVNAAS